MGNVGIELFRSEETDRLLCGLARPAQLFEKWVPALSLRCKTGLGEEDVGCFGEASPGNEKEVGI